MQKSQSGSLCNTILHKIRRGDLKNPESSCICLINHIKTSPEHSSQHFSETYFYNSLRKHFSTTLLHNCSKQLLYKTYVQRSFQHPSPTRPCITLVHFSTTSFYSILLQDFNPKFLSSTSRHNSAPTLLSAKLFSNTFLNQSHVSNASLQHSQTLLNKTLLQHFATKLFSNTSPQHFST